MKSRQSVDPELHILRSAVQRAEGRERQSLESARFHLFQAFETQDAESAKRWAAAMKAAILVWNDDSQGQLQKLALDALARIEKAI